MDRGAWQATVHGITESDMTEEHTRTHTQEECGVLVPQSGTEPKPPVLEAWSLNYWTARKSLPQRQFFFTSVLSTEGDSSSETTPARTSFTQQTTVK